MMHTATIDVVIRQRRTEIHRATVITTQTTRNFAKRFVTRNVFLIIERANVKLRRVKFETQEGSKVVFVGGDDLERRQRRQQQLR